jgi:sec-independent protein translocase protein TatA
MGPEIIILIVVVGILIFGAAKIPKLAKTFGKAKGEFEKGKIEADRELKNFKEETSTVAKEETSTVAKEETSTVAKEETSTVAKEETSTVAKDKEVKSD